MNIEQTGTFTIDLEPNWNAIIQLAIEMLGSNSKQERKGGAEIVRECAEAMAEKGAHLIIGEDTNFWTVDPSPRDDHLLEPGELVEFARSATIHVIESGGLQAVNFITLIGEWWEADRQARRS